MKNRKLSALVCLLLSAAVTSSYAFCGFYVSKADTKLFNKASKVVIVRDKDRTVLTMANDFQGDPKEFAIVIPVPTFLERAKFTSAKVPTSIISMLTHHRDWLNILMRTRADRDSIIYTRRQTRLTVGLQEEAMRERSLWALRSRHSTPSASMTSRSSRLNRAMDWKPGCAKTATSRPGELLGFLPATSSRRCASSSRK